MENNQSRERERRKMQRFEELYEEEEEEEKKAKNIRVKKQGMPRKKFHFVFIF